MSQQHKWSSSYEKTDESNSRLEILLVSSSAYIGWHSCDVLAKACPCSNHPRRDSSNPASTQCNHTHWKRTASLDTDFKNHPEGEPANHVRRRAGNHRIQKAVVARSCLLGRRNTVAKSAQILPYPNACTNESLPDRYTLSTRFEATAFHLRIIYSRVITVVEQYLWHCTANSLSCSLGLSFHNVIYGLDCGLDLWRAHVLHAGSLEHVFQGEKNGVWANGAGT